MALLLGSGMIYGVKIVLSRILFRCHFVLLGIGMQWWLTLGVLVMLKLVGTLTSPGWCMVGRWTPSLLSSMFCILLDWVRRVMIAYVGCPKKENLLRSKLFIRFFFLMVFPLSLGRAFGGLRLI